MRDYKTDLINNFILSINNLELTKQQILMLENTLTVELHKYDLTPIEKEKELPMEIDDFNYSMLERFLMAKAIQSLSKNSLKLYKYRIQKFIDFTDKKVIEITTDDIRYYMAITKSKNKVSNTTMENIRLVLSSFFGWLQKEEYIMKNPMDRICPIKKDTIKETPFTQSDIELMCRACDNNRDRAMIEFMLSTGLRVSEICSVKREQINFYTKELNVIGKGNKERTVYLSDRACVYLKIYLDERKDDNPYLFVSLNKNHKPIKADGVESVIKKVSTKANVINAHPHRFRRTTCCSLIDKGMPIQNCKEIMGHSSIETTMIYYNGNITNIKHSFQMINNI